MKLLVCSSVVAARPNLLKTSEVVFGLPEKQADEQRYKNNNSLFFP